MNLITLSVSREFSIPLLIVLLIVSAANWHISSELNDRNAVKTRFEVFEEGRGFLTRVPSILRAGRMEYGEEIVVLLPNQSEKAEHQ